MTSTVDERLRLAEADLAAERRHAHRLRVVLFLVFVALCAAMTAVLHDRPSYLGNHGDATIRECLKVMREHASPDTRKQAIWVGLHQCVLFLDELVLYALVGRASAQHGSWGLMEKWGDDAAPKMVAVRSWLAGNGGGSGGGGGGGQEIAARVAALEAIVSTLQAQAAQAIADAAAANAEIRRLQSALRDAVR